MYSIFICILNKLLSGKSFLYLCYLKWFPTEKIKAIYLSVLEILLKPISLYSLLTEILRMFSLLLFLQLTSVVHTDNLLAPFCQKYVQDVLREHLSETVYQWLRKESGHIYVCGDVTMAGDVLKTVQQIIKQQGHMSLEDAGFYISKLRVSERTFNCASLSP